MKKLLFSGTILVSCSLLHAQQKLIPAFRDYLNNKQAFSSPGYYIPVNPGKNNTPFNEFTDKRRLKPEELNNYIEAQKQNSSLPGSFASILPDGNQVYILPQDNLPCVVPDLSQFNMPVVKGDNTLDKKINASGGNN